MTMNDASIPELPRLESLWQSTLGWQPNEMQQQQFQELYAEVVAGNRHFNLTRITAPEEFWEKHLWDSLSGIQPWLMPEGKQPEGAAEPDAEPMQPLRILDIGSGAGFPGLPIALVLPQAAVTMLDSTQKKVAFLRSVIEQRGLTQCRAVCDRAEAIGHHPDHRETYDVVTVRAVAAASVCAEYSLPLLKIGGVAILYRGQWTSEEADALATAAKQLGGQVERVAAFKTPLTQSDRHCVYVRKVTPTPVQFPRPIGVPTQKPLA